MFEKILKKQIVDFLENNNLFNPGQHGFRKCRSCLSELLAHYDEILAELGKGKNVDVAYLDFSKAFTLEFSSKICSKLVFEVSYLIGSGLFSQVEASQ